MRLPFVSAATYDWAIRHSERLADEAQQYATFLSESLNRESRLQARNAELLDIIVAMKKQNFVVDQPITHTPLTVDEADEYAAEEDATVRAAMLKRKLS